MDGKKVRSWCGRFQWPGKDEFLFGTIILDVETMHHNLEKNLYLAFDKAWGSILPDEVSRPLLIGFVAGAIFFVPEEGMMK